MLWDASYDMNNFINGKAYSSIMKTIIDGTYKNDDILETTNKDHCAIFVVRVVGTNHTIRIRYLSLFYSTLPPKSDKFESLSNSIKTKNS